MDPSHVSAGEWIYLLAVLVLMAGVSLVSLTDADARAAYDGLPVACPRAQERM